MFVNTWNRIVSWFKDRSERNKLIRSFNDSAREAFVNNEAPVVLEASISRGDPEYKHTFSNLLSSGFRIKVGLSGRPLTKDEIIYIGNIILSNDQLVRRLVVLGWDTLEIHSENSTYGCKWRLSEYMKTIKLIT